MCQAMDLFRVKMMALQKALGAIMVVLVLSSPAVAKIHAKTLTESLFAAAQVSPPLDQEVCFSPQGACDAKLVRFIQSAKKSIDVAIYDLNLEVVKHELLEQSKRIPVRVIVDRRQAHEEHSSVPSLIQLKANIRYGRQRGIFHNKFMIVDGVMIETGSFNYTHNAASNNNENQVYLASAVIVEQYRKHFEELWKRAVSADRP